MLFTVNDYLNKTKEEEKEKPPALRKVVPSITELAEAADVSRQSFYRWLNNPYLDDRYFEAIITKMRSCGFDTDINDLVKYVPPEGK